MKKMFVQPVTEEELKDELKSKKEKKK